MAAERLIRSPLAPLAFAFACATTERPVQPSAPPPTPVVREHWPRFAEVEAWPVVNTTAFATRGHLVAPGHALVRVSPDAREQYLGLVADSILPDGAIVAMFHQSRDGRQKGLVYVMEKKATAWTFLALDSDGSLTSENLNVCALCHRAGVADQLFGLPRSLTAPSNASASGAAAPAEEWDGGARR